MSAASDCLTAPALTDLTRNYGRGQGIGTVMSERSRRAGQPPADLAAARSLLTGERASAEARLTALQRDFDGIVCSSASGATDDEHDPEGGTTAFERQHVAALIRAARDRLGEVENAVRRLADGSYGNCEQCGAAIAAGRLAARPTARSCMDCAAAPGGTSR